MNLVGLLTEISVDQLRNHFVDTEKITPEAFEEILKVTKGTLSWTAWMCKKVEQELIQEEDIYKYEQMLNFFSKYKRFFKNADLLKYKTPREFEEWKKELFNLEQKLAASRSKDTGEKTDGFVSDSEMLALQEAGVKFEGVVDNYQVFHIPQGSGTEVFNVYTKYLGRCKDKSDENVIKICTFNRSHFNSYIQRPGGLYVFYNLNDPLSPYQFCEDTGEFRDKNDQSII